MNKKGTGGRETKTTSYFYDETAVVLEESRSEEQVLTTSYIHGANIDEPLALINNKGSYFYHADGLGSIVAITDHNGAIAQKYDYDSFGNMPRNRDSMQPYGFTGREYDVETGLYYYRARYYDPTIGRFIQRDPISFAGGDWNLYGYVQNNPVNWVDPMGLEKGDWYDIRSYADPLLWQTVKEDFASGAATHRAVAAAKAELGIIAGSAQLAYCVFTRGLTAKAIGAHGIGNYLGSIGELSNVIYGGNSNCNVTKKVYETAAKSVLGEASYGATAFYATDFLLGLSMMLKSVRVDDVVPVGKGVGVTLERRRWIPSERLQPPAIILNDIFSEDQDLKQTYFSSTNKKYREKE